MHTASKLTIKEYIKKFSEIYKYYDDKFKNEDKECNMFGVKEKFYKFEENYDDNRFRKNGINFKNEIPKLIEIYKSIEKPKIKGNCDVNLRDLFYKKIKIMNDSIKNIPNCSHENYQPINNNVVNNIIIDNVNPEKTYTLKDKLQLLIDNNIIINEIANSQLYCSNDKYNIIFKYCENKLIPITVEDELNKINYSVENEDISTYPNIFTFLASEHYDKFINDTYGELLNIKKIIENNIKGVIVSEDDFSGWISCLIKAKTIINKYEETYHLEYKNNQYTMVITDNEIKFDDKNIKLNENYICEIEKYLESKSNEFVAKYYGEFKKYLSNTHSFGEYLSIQLTKSDNSINLFFQTEQYHNTFLYDTELDSNLDYPNCMLNIEVKNKDKNDIIYVKTKLCYMNIKKSDVDNKFSNDIEIKCIDETFEGTIDQVIKYIDEIDEYIKKKIY